MEASALMCYSLGEEVTLIGEMGGAFRDLG